MAVILRTRAVAASLVAAAGALASCDDSPTGAETAPIPAAVQVVSGDAQEGAVGAALPEPIVVKVIDASGAAVAGYPVSFRVTSGAGTIASLAAETDAQGLARARWTLGTSTGDAQRAEAFVEAPTSGTSIVSPPIRATPRPGPAATLRIIAGDEQEATVGTTLPEPIEVTAFDQYGNPVPGARVEWSVAAGGGSVSAASSTTGPDGRASTRWTLGPAGGEHRLTATAGAASTSFTARALAGSGAVQLRVQEIAANLSSPLYLTTAPTDDRLFIVEQTGRIRIIESGTLLAAPFLDLSARISCCGERGLLGLAFHPQYGTNGYLYVSYTDPNGDSRIERYTVSADRNVVDASSAKLILGVAQPFANHNGGQITFGRDGLLYIALGDGGSGGDPQGNGQKLTTLLGKLLRLDVDRGDPYAIPSDNPFRDRSDARPEIWAYGLRNPWRWSFDDPEGRLYIADVGQNVHEEVNVVGTREAALNYGWNIMEGQFCFNSATCNRSGLVIPVIDYDHAQGCSVTGGYVYRGEMIPEIRGHYFYSDFCKGWLRSFRYDGAAAADQKEWAVELPPSVTSLGNVTSFGVDRRGELYVIGSGRVLKIVRGN